MAKKFFYVCAGLFLLAVSYQLGADRVAAQVGTNGVGFAAWGNYVYVMTASGEVYARNTYPQTSPGAMDASPPAVDLGNFWGGATASTLQSWGQVKDRYRK